MSFVLRQKCQQCVVILFSWMTYTPPVLMQLSSLFTGCCLHCLLLLPGVSWHLCRKIFQDVNLNIIQQRLEIITISAKRNWLSCVILARCWYLLYRWTANMTFWQQLLSSKTINTNNVSVSSWWVFLLWVILRVRPHSAGVDALINIKVRLMVL